MDHLLAFGTVWSLFTATASVIFAVFSHRRQVNASVYLELSKQLHELYKRMPKKGSGDIGGAAVEDLVFDSLQLIRSAYTLSVAGYFEGRLWATLRLDGEKGLRKPAFLALWPNLKREFVNDPEFVAYVDKVQSTAGRPISEVAG